LSPLRTGLLVDLNDLYNRIQERFGPNRRLKILNYVHALEGCGHMLTYKIAYSRQTPRQVGPFLSMLKANGFETHFAATQWNVSMALRVAEMIPNIDCLVLGTANAEMSRALEWARRQGKLTKCFAVNIPKHFKQFAECMEVTEEMLYEVAGTA
jgi:hypothetical protein